MSKCNIGYSYNGTDGTNAIYTAIPNGSTVWFSINGNTKVGQELGLSQQYEGAEIIIWKSSDWRGGALAIGGNGSPVMIGQNNGSNSIKWNPLALKSDLNNVSNKLMLDGMKTLSVKWVGGNTMEFYVDNTRVFGISAKWDGNYS